MHRNILHFFDKLEDKTRARLSRLPILYALLGGIGVVLFWRGVWHTTDLVTFYLLGEAVPTFVEIVDGPISFVIGTAILLVTGVYVSAFIGNRLIISGLSGDKKLAEKTEEEIETEEQQIKKIQSSLTRIESEIDQIESEMKEKK